VLPWILGFHHTALITPNHSVKIYHSPIPISCSLYQQKNHLLETDRACVQTAHVRPMRSAHPECLPLCHVLPGHPGILGFHLQRLLPPNPLVPVLNIRCTCRGLIASKYPPSVSSCLGASRVYLSDSGSPMAKICLATPHKAFNTLPILEADYSPHQHPTGTLPRLLPSATPCWRPSRNLTLVHSLLIPFADSDPRPHPAGALCGL